MAGLAVLERVGKAGRACEAGRAGVAKPSRARRKKDPEVFWDS